MYKHTFLEYSTINLITAKKEDEMNATSADNVLLSAEFPFKLVDLSLKLNFLDSCLLHTCSNTPPPTQTHGFLNTVLFLV